MSSGETHSENRTALRPVLTVASVVAVLAMAAAMGEGGPVRLYRAWSIEQVLLETALGACHSPGGHLHARSMVHVLVPDPSVGNESLGSDEALQGIQGQCVTRWCGIGMALIGVHPDLALVAHRVAGLSPPGR
jgi:hypothetical protein